MSSILLVTTPMASTRNAKKKHRRPDDVYAQFPEGSIKLFTRLRPPTEDDPMPTVVFEGDRASLEYLGEMILAQARFPNDCGFGIAPNGAGKAFFRRKSQVAIYIHRLPCLNIAASKARGRTRKPLDS